VGHDLVSIGEVRIQLDRVPEPTWPSPQIDINWPGAPRLASTEGVLYLHEI